MQGKRLTRNAAPPAVAPALGASWRYVAEQFPPLQAGALAFASLVGYAVFGRLAGDVTLELLAIAVALTVALLFLQLRLVDDIHTWYDTDGEGDIGGASLRGLVVGTIVTTVAIAALNVADPVMLATALGTTMFMVVTSCIIRAEGQLPAAVRMALGRIPLFEVAPAAMLVYVYVGWRAATGESLPAGDVAVVVGVLLTSFNFWKLSRHLGDRPRERIYQLTWPVVRVLCTGLLAASLAFNVLLYDLAGFSVVFLVITVAIVATFAVFSRPRREPDTSRPPWVGLPFAILMTAVLFVQVAAVA
jgi:hypothetical protein